jgi:uncharacterized protein YmfQ (DUF2313 family)
MSTLLKTLADATPYRRMLAKLLPRGPIWDLVSQAGLLALVDGLAAELKRVHNRLVDARAEADPRTTDELLDEWLTAWDVDGTTNADLVAKVTATGGQSRAYFIRVVRAILGDEDAEVTITERPYGRTFRAWSGKAWDPVNGTPAEFYWRVTVPYGTDADTVDIIEAALERTKPAHTIVEVVLSAAPAYYLSSPGGAGDYAEASTTIAARTLFPGGGIGPASVVFWIRAHTSGSFLASVTDDNGTRLNITASTDPLISASFNGVDAFCAAEDIGYAIPEHVCITHDGTTAAFYLDGVEQVGFDPGAQDWSTTGTVDTFRLFARGSDAANPAAAEIAAPAIFDRALSAGEVAALHAAGSTHDLLTTTGAYATADPVILWDGPDAGGYVANRGSGGVCNLTLVGDVTVVAL